jgi:hypothetical protein
MNIAGPESTESILRSAYNNADKASRSPLRSSQPQETDAQLLRQYEELLRQLGRPETSVSGPAAAEGSSEPVVASSSRT